MTIWNTLKDDLDCEFHRPDPAPELTPVAEHIQVALEQSDYQLNPVNAGHIPVYQEGLAKQIHLFPTQFNDVGQRKNE
ncbi:MAG: hypothetical protein HC810_07170 [Acaryochloridaceae cyanobacterium RL_2_7]|nr:hypothetical protein [Acaryochloridaceae cyanobacterium RL_2_7]